MNRVLNDGVLIIWRMIGMLKAKIKRDKEKHNDSSETAEM